MKRILVGLALLITFVVPVLASDFEGLNINLDRRTGILYLMSDLGGGTADYDTFVQTAQALGVSPGTLLEAFQAYLAIDVGVQVTRTTDQSFVSAIVSIGRETSGLNVLLAAQRRGEPLPTTMLDRYLSDTPGKGIPQGKSHDCGKCPAGQLPSVYCGVGTCVLGCGKFEGVCYEVDVKDKGKKLISFMRW